MKRNIYTLDHVTAMITSCANGDILPSFLIFKGSLPEGDKWMDGVPLSWGFAASESGFMNADLFRQWCQFLIRHLQVKLRHGKCILIMDNASFHVDLKSAELCKAAGLELVCLPSNASHILQPNDKFFHLLKNEIAERAEILHWLTGLVISKGKLPILLAQAIPAALTKTNVKAAWAHATCWPIDIKKVDQKYLAVLDPEG